MSDAAELELLTRWRSALKLVDRLQGVRGALRSPQKQTTDQFAADLDGVIADANSELQRLEAQIARRRE